MANGAKGGREQWSEKTNRGSQADCLLAVQRRVVQLWEAVQVPSCVWGVQRCTPKKSLPECNGGRETAEVQLSHK